MSKNLSPATAWFQFKFETFRCSICQRGCSFFLSRSTKKNNVFTGTGPNSNWIKYAKHKQIFVQCAFMWQYLKSFNANREMEKDTNKIDQNLFIVSQKHKNHEWQILIIRISRDGLFADSECHANKVKCHLFISKLNKACLFLVFFFFFVCFIICKSNEIAIHV